MIISSLVYFLCAATSLLCAILLLSEHRRRRSRLLLWSGVSFVVFAISNTLAFADFVVLPTIDLSGIRAVTALAAASILVAGLIWEVD